jgi:S1-C subfamily serine protease
LRTGDVVLSVNGDRTASARALIRAVAAMAPGTEVRLSVRRGTKSIDIPVTVGRRPPDSAG